MSISETSEPVSTTKFGTVTPFMSRDQRISGSILFMLYAANTRTTDPSGCCTYSDGGSEDICVYRTFPWSQGNPHTLEKCPTVPHLLQRLFLAGQDFLLAEVSLNEISLYLHFLVQAY